MTEKFPQYFAGQDISRLARLIEREFGDNIVPLKTRLLSAIASSQAIGNRDLLKGFVLWGLDSDVLPKEIYEILLQGHLFCGYPKAIESFFDFQDILKCKGIEVGDFGSSGESWNSHLYKERGNAIARKIYGRNFDLVFRNLYSLSPELAMGMIREGYGRIISRAGVDLVIRELSIIAILTVNSMPRQLYSHIRGAINVGALKSQVDAIIRQCCLFVDGRIIEEALLVSEKSLGK